MKIEVIVVGKNKFSFIQEAISEYEKKLRQYATLSFVEIKEESIGKDLERVKKIEGERIIEKLKDGYIKIAMDVRGIQHDSVTFSKELIDIRDYKGGNIQFIIGGSLGLSGEVFARVDESMSFSKMTFSHQLIRLILLEQLYRGFEIASGGHFPK